MKTRYTRRFAMAFALVATALAPAFIPSRTAQAADAGTVIQTTKALGGPWVNCLLGIEDHETGGTYDPYAYNPSSGAEGPLQFLEQGGVWDSTPLGREGVSVAAASIAQQVEQAVWVLWNVGPSPWSQTAPASCYGGS